MGCKQCKIFLPKHRVNDYINPTVIDQNITTIQFNEQIIIPADKTALKIHKKSRKLKFTTITFPSLPTFDHLPVELIYQIFDQLDTYTIVTSLYNVSKRLNSIIRTYDQYDLNFKSISMTYFHRICSVIRPEQITSLTLSDGDENVGLVEVFLRRFHWESFKRLRSLTLIDIDDNEQMTKILLSITNQLQRLSIKNSNEDYNDTVIDILMIMIGKESLHYLSLDIDRNRISNPLFMWPMECFLHEIKLIGLCNLSLFRNILIHSPNLKKFQAHDIDLDDEWIDNDENEEDEIEQRQMLPISNTSNLTSLSLIYARNEMDKLEWFLPQFPQLKYFKYLNIYDLQTEFVYGNDYSLLDGERWEKLLCNCNQFEFTFTVHFDDDSWNVRHYLATFQTRFWQEKDWNIALERYEKLLLIYTLPYAHSSYYYDRTIFFSIPQHPFFFSQSMQNVTKLRVNLAAVINLGKIAGSPRFFNVSHLILDGQWRNLELAASIASLVHLSNITKFTRLERTPTLIFQSFIHSLSNLQFLTLTTCVLDSLNAAVFQYIHCLHSLTIVQLHDGYRHFVNVEPFCTMFPQIEHLDIPIDNLDSCQYIIDRLEEFLISVIFRLPHDETPDEDEDEDENDEDDDTSKSNELVEWAQHIQQNHQYRVRDGDMYLWLR